MTCPDGFGLRVRMTVLSRTRAWATGALSRVALCFCAVAVCGVAVCGVSAPIAGAASLLPNEASCDLSCSDRDLMGALDTDSANQQDILPPRLAKEQDFLGDIGQSNPDDPMIAPGLQVGPPLQEPQTDQ